MTTHHDDDREFDAFLRGEDDLSALLRQAPQPEVPPELDARILAQARSALAEPAHAGREAANDPAPMPWLMRMRVPLGLAATVVIGVSLGLRWTGWQEGTPVVLVSDSDPAAAAAPPPPAVAAKPGVQAEAAAPRGQDESGAVASGAVASGAAAPSPAAPPVRARAVPVPAPAPAPATVAAAPAEAEVRPPPPPPPPPPPAPAPMAPPAPAPMALPAPAPAAPSVYYRAAPPAPPAPAPAAPAPQASTHVEVTGSRIARNSEAASDPRAEQWLALLTELLDRHLDDDARDNWARFRREFPDYPVPPGLQARIDALQPTQ